MERGPGGYISKRLVLTMLKYVPAALGKGGDVMIGKLLYHNLNNVLRKLSTLCSHQFTVHNSIVVIVIHITVTESADFGFILLL